MKKIELGQFFTVRNPFDIEPFHTWASQFSKQEKVLEPFAGANHIIRHLQSLGYAENFASFDIDPADKIVKKKDTLKFFPTGYKVGITNPPYLAANTIRVKKITGVDLEGYRDMYQLALSRMLDNLEYVAAIIPEVFIVSGLFQNRLQYFISINEMLFDDTAVPVCLALWGPDPQTDFKVYHGAEYVGMYSTFTDRLPSKNDGEKFLIFNIPDGEIGLIGMDNSVNASIRFCRGADIPPNTDICALSRHITRIWLHHSFTTEQCDTIIAAANELLAEYRELTHDVFLSAFKNIRRDKKYRRRLDFRTARNILGQAISLVLADSNVPLKRVDSYPEPRNPYAEKDARDKAMRHAIREAKRQEKFLEMSV